MTSGTCDCCIHWMYRDNPESWHCEMYRICPTADIYEFMVNVGNLGKCPLFEEDVL